MCDAANPSLFQALDLELGRCEAIFNNAPGPLYPEEGIKVSIDEPTEMATE